MKYAKKQKPLEDGGFRIAWFIPVEMVISGTMLLAAPFIGLPLAILLVGIISATLIIKVDQYIPCPTYIFPHIPQQHEYSTTKEFLDAQEAWLKAGTFESTYVAQRPLPKLPRLRIKTPKIHASVLPQKAQSFD